MFCGLILLPENLMVPFLFITESNSIVCMFFIFIIHPLVDGQLGCFYFFAVVNIAVINRGEQVARQ